MASKVPNHAAALMTGSCQYEIQPPSMVSFFATGNGLMQKLVGAGRQAEQK
jgi:hypothetical protein